MAGRGTDIKLGGDPEMMAQMSVKGRPQLSRSLERYRVQCEEEKARFLLQADFTFWVPNVTSLEELTINYVVVLDVG